MSAEHTGTNPCARCGGEECGLHPLGCIYGGFTERTAYWLAVDGCELDHDGPAGDEMSGGDASQTHR